jgi:hypothetical protein
MGTRRRLCRKCNSPKTIISRHGFYKCLDCDYEWEDHLKKFGKEVSKDFSKFAAELANKLGKP